MKRLVRYALHQPLFIMLGALLFTMAGVIAFTNLSVEAFPDVTDTPGHGDRALSWARGRGG